MVSTILKFFKILNSEDSPLQIALAIWFAFLISFLSVLNPLAIVIFFVVCIVRVNLTAFLLFWVLFVLMLPLYAPLADTIGYYVLTKPEFYATLKGLYNAGGAAVEINHTLVTGGVLFSLALLPLFVLLLPKLIMKYRDHLLPFINKLRVVQTLKASKLYQMYTNFS